MVLLSRPLRRYSAKTQKILNPLKHQSAIPNLFRPEALVEEEKGMQDSLCAARSRLFKTIMNAIISKEASSVKAVLQLLKICMRNILEELRQRIDQSAHCDCNSAQSRLVYYLFTLLDLVNNKAFIDKSGTQDEFCTNAQQHLAHTIIEQRLFYGRRLRNKP